MGPFFYLSQIGSGFQKIIPRELLQEVYFVNIVNKKEAANGGFSVCIICLRLYN